MCTPKQQGHHHVPGHIKHDRTGSALRAGSQTHAQCVAVISEVAHVLHAQRSLPIYRELVSCAIPYFCDNCMGAITAGRKWGIACQTNRELSTVACVVGSHCLKQSAHLSQRGCIPYISSSSKFKYYFMKEVTPSAEAGINGEP